MHQGYWVGHSALFATEREPMGQIGLKVTEISYLQLGKSKLGIQNFWRKLYEKFYLNYLIALIALIALTLQT